MKRIIVVILVVCSNLFCSSFQKNEKLVELRSFRLFYQDGLRTNFSVYNGSNQKISHVILKLNVKNDGRSHVLNFRAGGSIPSGVINHVNCEIKDFRDISRIELQSILIIYKNNSVIEIPKYRM